MSIASVMPREIYEAMSAEGMNLTLLPAHDSIGSRLAAVDCSPEIAVWCCRRAQFLLMLAETVETALSVGREPREGLT